MSQSSPPEHELPALRPLRALVVDDEKNIRTTLSVCLEGIGCEVKTVATTAAALAAQAEKSFDIAFLDLRLGTENGLELIPKLLSDNPNLDIVAITAYGTVDTAVEAIKRGAVDYVQKPFTPDQIRHAVAQVAERRAIVWRLAEKDQELHAAVPEVDLDTRSSKMQATLETVNRAAVSDISVLLRGENGTGKGVLARLLHAESPRREFPFVVINCPTLSEELLTSELFGHTRGAFTGAVRDQPGRVEAAEGGTLFLDEVAEIPPNLQAKLLRYLQEKRFERVGEQRTRQSDVRIIAATNRNLEQDVEEGRFRQDLLYRLNVVEIHVAPLRERPEDILPLARRFLAFFARTAPRRANAFARGRSRAGAISLAGQRPRTPQHHGAGRHPLAGADHRAAGFSRSDVGSASQRPAHRRRLDAGRGRARTHSTGNGPSRQPGRSGPNSGDRCLDAVAEAEAVRAALSGFNAPRRRPFRAPAAA